MISYTVATNIITVTGYSEVTPCNFTDLYNTDKAGTLSLHARTGITVADGAVVAVDRAERPADYIVLGGASNDLYITVANWNGTTATIRITGTDRDGAAQTEDIVVNANGQYNTTKWFKTITHTQVTSATVTSFDYDLTQGQWGVVWKQGTAQFQIDCKIDIGDGTTTWFADEIKQLVFSDGIVTANNQYIIDTKANGHFRLGKEHTDVTVGNPCSIIFEETTYYSKNFPTWAYNNFYGCQFYGKSNNGRIYLVSVIDVHSCMFNDFIYFEVRGSTDVNNVIMNNVNEGFRLKGSGTVNNYFIFGSTYMTLSVGATVKNLYARETTYLNIWASSGNAYLIDADLNAWTFIHRYAGFTIYRQYTLNLKVLDTNQNNVENATVILKDKDNNEIFVVTTNASGEITEQTVSYGYYNQANGNTLQSYSPHTLEIRKAGYKTYKKKFTLDSKTDWTIALQRIAINIDMEVIA